YVPYGLDTAVAAKGDDRDGRPRLGGIADHLAPLIEEATGIETRSTVLGHLQRGGSPTAYDRVLSTRLGMAAADMAVAREWGRMAWLDGTDIVRVRMADAVRGLKRVPLDRWQEMQVLLG